MTTARQTPTSCVKPHNGTPTLFINGRKHVIPDYSDTVLEFVLEDEEEWLKRGWKD